MDNGLFIFENKILSINGDESDYMTIEEAESYGLFHPNCDHILEELELEPIDNGGEGVIKLNKENQIIGAKCAAGSTQNLIDTVAGIIEKIKDRIAL